jgi:hypothetical protein
MSFITRSALLLSITAVIAACGGGGGSGSAPSPQNTAPRLTGVGNQSIDQDTSTAALPISVSDDGGVDAVGLAVSSSDAAIVAREGIVLGGSGANRTVTITPAEDATGQVNVMVTATDAQGLASTLTIPVTVRAVQRSIAGYTATTFAQMENDDPAKVSGFTFIQDADDNAFDSLLQ